MITRATVTALVLLSVASAASAQLPPGLPIPPENYATTHFWGSPSAITMRNLAMGGAYVADNRSAWHGNAASLIAVKKPTYLTSETATSFKSLPTFRSRVYGYARPLSKDARNVVKLTWIPVRAEGTITSTPVPIGFQANENDLGLELGHRVSPRLSIGLGMAYMRTDSDYRIPGLGTVTSLRSHPTGLGGRLGLIYDLGETLSIGATYDNYTEAVSRSAPAFQLPAESFRFRSGAYRTGLALRPDSKTTVLVDYESLRLTGDQTQVGRHAWMAGAERRVGGVLLRVGSFDGKLTGGIGLERGRMRLHYGFTGRYDRNLPGQGARTMNGVEMAIAF